jgi:bifunctional NMN adenylyltransferase/nudix hydrolase
MINGRTLADILQQDIAKAAQQQALQRYTGLVGSVKAPVRPHKRAIVVGRFQPLHSGHIDMIRGALKVADKVLVVIGSAWEAQTLKNPFTYEMRKAMVEAEFAAEIKDARIVVDGLEDYASLKKWDNKLLQLANKHFYTSQGVVWYTYGKDASTKDYINACKVFNKHMHSPTNALIDATSIRNDFYDGVETLGLKHISNDVAIRLHSFKLTEEYEAFVKEWKALKEYRQLWQPLKITIDGKTIERNPFPVQFVAVDALVEWQDKWKKPHILVIRRKSEFGNGKLAIPGGYLNHDETVLTAAKRELLEETALAVDDSFILSKTTLVDDPNRSMRGRMMTHVHQWRVCSYNKPTVVGGDDASEAFWLPIDEVYANKKNFFSDHYFIIASHFPEVEEDL